jgi:hypothetical protein
MNTDMAEEMIRNDHFRFWHIASVVAALRMSDVWGRPEAVDRSSNRRV